jgi:hypothetical protein
MYGSVPAITPPASEFLLMFRHPGDAPVLLDVIAGYDPPRPDHCLLGGAHSRFLQSSLTSEGLKERALESSTGRSPKPRTAGQISGSSLILPARRSQSFCVRFEFAHFLVGQPIQLDHATARSRDRFDELIKFETSGPAIAVLSVLDKKYHQECKDRDDGVDCELPSIRVVEVRAREAHISTLTTSVAERPR